MDLRAVSRFLRSSGVSSDLSLLRSEYQGLRSLADGAKGTPFSVSAGSTFFVARIAAIMAVCSKSSKKLIWPPVVGRTAPLVELPSAIILSRSSSFRFFFEDFSVTPARSRS